jgi:hypothetical protein
MKSIFPLPAIAIASGGALAALTLVLVAHKFGNQPSMTDLEGAAELGGAIGGTLVYAWPFRLLTR